MRLLKVLRDNTAKAILGSASVPKGMFDLSEYTRCFNGINFDFNFDKENGIWFARSNNFRQGVIIAEGRTLTELDRNIKDAILTAFEIPSSYKKEASIKRIDEKKKEYALA